MEINTRKRKKRKAKKKRIIIATCITLAAVIFVGALYSNYKYNSYNILATIAKNTVRKKMADLVLYEGRHEIPANKFNTLHIEASQFDRYGLEFDGRTTIYIDYFSLSTSTAEASETVVATGECMEDKSILDIQGIKDTFRHVETSELTKDEKTMSFKLEEADKLMAEKGMDVNGSNVVVTRVYAEKPELTSQEAQEAQETGGSSGLVPKDEVLKTWYYYFEYCRESAKAVNEQIGGEYYSPWALVGTMLRETGDTTCSKLNAADFNIEKDLNGIYAGPNDMANQVQLLARSSKNNAIGMYQFDPSTFMSSGRVFGNIHHTDREMDATMGFVRSNPWYTKDITWSGAFYAGSYIEFNKSDKAFVDEILNSDGFKSLADVDKQFIYGFMTEIHHNYGNIQSSDRQADTRKLIEIGNNLQSYGISALYEMCDKVGVETFNIDNKMKGHISTSEDAIVSEITSTYGIVSKYSQGYIEALCGGYKAYKAISSEIDAAEKIGGGTGNGNAEFLSIALYVFQTWRDEGHSYEQAWHTSTTFGAIRTDCSGYTSTCLKLYGLASNNGQYLSKNFVANSMEFEVIGSWEEKQPGDIVAWDGHVCIFAGYDENGTGTWLSWGSVKQATADPIPNPSYDNGAHNSYNNKNGIILRVPKNTSG